jgi:hypothetical protein
MLLDFSTSEFNYWQAYLQVTRKDVTPPDVEVVSISQTGIVTLRFTKTMITPPKSVLKSFSLPTIENNGTLYAPVHVAVKPGYYSDVEKLGLSYDVTDFYGDLMTIQVRFENPVHISATFEEPDLLTITFYGWFLFFDTEGGFIEKDKTLD